MTLELDKRYDPKAFEEKWYDFWEQNGFFTADPESSKPHFSLVIPPPNITGTLHMGHAFEVSLIDCIVRWKRMKGFDTLWLPGTDHAGIATQIVVEKELRKEGKTRHDLGREAFVERVWKWREESGGIILKQLRRIGASCDWSREKFTLDDALSKAVRKVFVDLYNEGLIYRGEYIVNWCPRCQTALSDLEADDTPRNGKLWHIRYPVIGTEQGNAVFITVATTRPETMLGDTGVAVHPDDDRYKKLVGKKVKLPLTDREIPIVADDFVEMDFGSGAVKITPAHDQNDFESGKRNNLPPLVIMDKLGKMNENAGKAYAGMDRDVARKQVVADLEKQDLMEKIEDYAGIVKTCSRCETVIEPYLSTQWFVKIKPLAEKAIEAVEKEETRIVPDKWRATYFEWMRNIHDWCISRQLWWGHSIPAWHCPCGEFVVAENAPSNPCRKCEKQNWTPDPDVLDTWFSSQLWPFSTLGWPGKTKDLEVYYPTTLLITGFDIIFFWVARMMMAGMHLMKEVPFREVYIHGLVRDSKGHKMSKSRGNTKDPLDFIDKYGADSLRFTFLSMAMPGTDIPLNEKRVEGYRAFTTKLWNAMRFAMMNCSGCPEDGLLPNERSLYDRWILSRLNDATKTVDDALGEYRFHTAADAVYHFLWDDFCSWYIELAKPALSGDNPKIKEQTQRVMIYTLDRVLRLLHPFMPFITEELWQKLPNRKEASLCIAEFPEPDASLCDTKAQQEMAVLTQVIGTIRSLRSEFCLESRKKINVRFSAPADLCTLLKEHQATLSRLTGLDNVEFMDAIPPQKGLVYGLAGDVKIGLPLEGMVDAEKECARMGKELQALEKELASTRKKLQNKNFVDKAPPEVVEEFRERETTFKSRIQKLEDMMAAFEA